MGENQSRQPGNNWILPILGLVVTLIGAYLTYKASIAPTIIPISYTQTAEARTTIPKITTNPTSRSFLLSTSTPSPTQFFQITPPSPVFIGKPAGDSERFYIYPDYSPSGWMGDTGDLKDPIKGPDGVTFVYEACGRGPRQDDNRYINGRLNSEPAKFAGILFLNPPNNFGTNSEGGFDLRGFKYIKWEARSLQGIVNIEFTIGGVNWIWNAQNQKETAPYSDSMPRKSLGTKTLKQEQDWQTFSVSLENLPVKDFPNVVGGFAWVIDWGSNDVVVKNPGTCPPQPKVFRIEIRNIRYEK